MTTHKRLIAARKEINKFPPLASRDIIYSAFIPITPTTKETFDGGKKNYVFADELLQWEVCPTQTENKINQ